MKKIKLTANMTEYMRSKVYCEMCDKYVSRRRFWCHKISKAHLLKESFKDIINKIKYLKQ